METVMRRRRRNKREHGKMNGYSVTSLLSIIIHYDGGREE
jgi:hypothetical protein